LPASAAGTSPTSCSTALTTAIGSGAGNPPGAACVVRGPDHVGDVVLMDEYVGKRRVRMLGIVVQVGPGQKIVWQLRKGVRLPAWLTLELADRDGGVDLRHTITAGFGGVGQVLDPLLRRYFSAEFATAMDEHARTELPLLRDHLAETRRTS
jgi:hypothetical protein